MSRSSARTQRRGPVVRLIGGATVALFLLLWACTSPTLSAWTSGVVVDSTNTAAAASVAFGHTAGGACALGPRVTSSVACPGSPVGTDSVTNNGTALSSSLSQKVSAASCAPVQLANAKAATDVMLPRYATTFQSTDPWGGTNAVTLGGGSAYAAAVTTDTTAAAGGSTYGMGIWFKASAGQSGPLMSMSASPTNTTGSAYDDRALYLGTDGKVSLVYMTWGLKVTTDASYNDGNWHFVYVNLSQGLLTTGTTLRVDSTSKVATYVLSGYNTGTGYWHLGWGSPALTGLSTSTFTGSLSNMVVFNGGTTPAAPPTAAQLASQSAFSAWATPTATDYWLLGDTGLTTYAGTNPTIGATSPCASLNVDWSFTNPAATAASSTQLSAFVAGGPVAVAAPAPGATQVSTLAISQRPSTYNAYVAGLRLLVPFTSKVTTTSGAWPLTFTWSSAVVVAP
jgi:hypothetical protein